VRRCALLGGSGAAVSLVLTAADLRAGPVTASRPRLDHPRKLPCGSAPQIGRFFGLRSRPEPWVAERSLRDVESPEGALPTGGRSSGITLHQATALSPERLTAIAAAGCALFSPVGAVGSYVCWEPSAFREGLRTSTCQW
jgi:hypothetical protein